ncbi:MAG: hypothetical protein IB618_00180 [Candidatus Pacearchaeota archaeon]|nr:MAG: hypothetical protein IB618_00180 [Candidatus Pacearchaeota archaeon]
MDRDKRGQVTLFIIIAIVIVAVVILAIVLVPQLLPRERIPPTVLDPEAYIADCVNLHLEPLVEVLASQGGYLETGNCIFYEDICRHYLCYTTTPYINCTNQEPLLKEHVEEELKTKLQQENVVKNCISSFAEAARKQNWNVEACSVPKFSVNLTEGRINIPIECDITMSKGQEVKKFEELNPFLKWPLFEFVILSKEIINEEIENCDFDPLAYMTMHYQIEIEKFRTGDGSKIYILRERETGKEFVFAVRNCVLPGGVF